MAKINNLELKEGMYISVIGMNVKNDNGLYIVEHDYSIKDKYATCSESICICKVNLNGEKSKSKYRLNFISEKSFTNNEDLQIKIINDLKSAKKEVNEYMKKREGKEIIVSFKESNKKLEKGSLIKFVKGYKCGFWGEVYIGTKSVWEVIDCNNRLEIKELGKKGQYISTGRYYSLNGNCLNQILDGEYITVLEKEEILKEEVKTNLKVNKENIATDELIETKEVKEVAATTKINKNDDKIESIEVKKVVFNEDKNGIEIYFAGKPSEEVRNNLKSNGFRWSKYNKCWYAKQNENTINFANTFTTQTEEIKESSEQYKEDKEREILNKLSNLNINDIENYTIDPDLSKRENKQCDLKLIYNDDIEGHKEYQIEQLKLYNSNTLNFQKKRINHKMIEQYTKYFIYDNKKFMAVKPSKDGIYPSSYYTHVKQYNSLVDVDNKIILFLDDVSLEGVQNA